jgi:hypothetical protein
MEHIGHVLYYAPADPNGLWIHKSVAELLDDRDAEHERQGFSIEVFNSRGAHWVDPTGKPERELAEMWRKKAQLLEAEGYIRFATELKKIVKHYEEETGQL